MAGHGDELGLVADADCWAACSASPTRRRATSPLVPRRRRRQCMVPSSRRPVLAARCPAVRVRACAVRVLCGGSTCSTNWLVFVSVTTAADRTRPPVRALCMCCACALCVFFLLCACAVCVHRLPPLTAWCTPHRWPYQSAPSRRAPPVSDHGPNMDCNPT